MIEEKYYKKLSEHVEFREGKPYWIKKPGRSTKVGSLAGTKLKDGYISIGITISGQIKSVFAHRLHWYMVHRELPKEIDHINRIKDDNRIENLRKVTRSQNRYNIKKRAGTSSKYRGVHFDKSKNLWVSRLTHNGEVIRLGRFKTEDEAGEAYNSKVQDLKIEEYIELNKIN